MILVGIFLAVLAAAIGTTSKQLIAASEHLKRPLLFHLGAGMNIALGPIVDASAYAFAPQVIVAPFACLDVIFNAITAPYTLHWQNERLTKVHGLGTALVSLGAIFTSVFADVDNKVYSVTELEAQLFFRPTSVGYLLVELTAIGMVRVALRKRWLNPAFRGISLGVIAGILMGNVFFLKGLIGIITTTASTGDFSAWLRPTPYILAAAAAGGAILGHIFMRKGLGEYKGVFMVTIFEGAHISAACLSGCVVMEEMAGSPFWRYITYWASVLCIVLGSMVVINKAAADAQIDGKFHIAQSYADVHVEETTCRPVEGPVIGRPLEHVKVCGGHDEQEMDTPRRMTSPEVTDMVNASEYITVSDSAFVSGGKDEYTGLDYIIEPKANGFKAHFDGSNL
eukprot:CAMPEP_0170317364 /NCGR_PEP_ID=MMETSP0116_2-20130129/59350_1 /TAXON_ID=400756 /ORGANISM="Durinskia baltica, Strain CSIRO CS-38" /LENGTH=395 /DNA_ID=CAMNT_0010570003 /DNA_START=42 /DNA_END=1226 /DNA_ORIENTATION=+